MRGVIVAPIGPPGDFQLGCQSSRPSMEPGSSAREKTNEGNKVLIFPSLFIGTIMRRVGGVLMAPAGVPVWNPAFDVTPAGPIAGIITGRGVAREDLVGQLAAWAAEDGRNRGMGTRER